MTEEEVPFQLEPIPWKDERGAWRARVRVYTEFPGEGLEETVLESREAVGFDDEAEARTYSERLGLKYLLDRARAAESDGEAGPDASAPRDAADG